MCRCNLESYHLYNPVSGITNNQSESFNAVLKRLQARKEIPVDTAVLSMYHLQVLLESMATRIIRFVCIYIHELLVLYWPVLDLIMYVYESFLFVMSL